MITADALKDRRIAGKRAEDSELAEADRLKARLARARDKRVPFYLSRDEFLAVCRWKLGDQYGRAARLLESNSEKRIKRATQMAFGFKDKDAEFELAGRLAILGPLPGVGSGSHRPSWASATQGLRAHRLPHLAGAVRRTAQRVRRGRLPAIPGAPERARRRGKAIDPKGAGKCRPSGTTPAARASRAPTDLAPRASRRWCSRGRPRGVRRPVSRSVQKRREPRWGRGSSRAGDTLVRRMAPR